MENRRAVRSTTNKPAPAGQPRTELTLTNKVVKRKTMERLKPLDLDADVFWELHELVLKVERFRTPFAAAAVVGSKEVAS